MNKEQKRENIKKTSAFFALFTYPIFHSAFGGKKNTHINFFLRTNKIGLSFYDFMTVIKVVFISIENIRGFVA